MWPFEFYFSIVTNWNIDKDFWEPVTGQNWSTMMLVYIEYMCTPIQKPGERNEIKRDSADFVEHMFLM